STRAKNLAAIEFIRLELYKGKHRDIEFAVFNCNGEWKYRVGDEMQGPYRRRDITSPRLPVRNAGKPPSGGLSFSPLPLALQRRKRRGTAIGAGMRIRASGLS